MNNDNQVSPMMISVISNHDVRYERTNETVSWNTLDSSSIELNELRGMIKQTCATRVLEILSLNQYVTFFVS